MKNALRCFSVAKKIVVIRIEGKVIDGIGTDYSVGDWARNLLAGLYRGNIQRQRNWFTKCHHIPLFE